MEMPDWKVVLGAVAPALATALGGPLAGVAVQAIGAALLGSKDVSAEEVEKAIAVAGPDALIELKKADLQFKRDMAQLGVDYERLAMEDRDSARRREVQSGDLWTPRLLAGGVTVGFFGVLVWLLWAGIPANGGEALLVMLGSLGAAWAGVISYYFGSSAGSRHKSDLLAVGERKS